MNALKNCWLPWKRVLLPDLHHDSSDKMLVVIPTAGNDINRLSTCINSVKKASGSLHIRVICVVCPATIKKIKNLKADLPKDVIIRSAKGPFNYCRSINLGIREVLPMEDHILFLNDDVTFLKKGDLHLLYKTAVDKRWACVGPHILFNPDINDDTWPKEKSSVTFKRRYYSFRTNSPVSGSCALWNVHWLKKVGYLDEQFGIGWGLDEADLCLRVTRLGGRYGKQGKVAIRHLMHASFGEQYTKYTGNAHTLSRKLFHKKYGREVEEWGRSHHWFPLPGIRRIDFIKKPTGTFIKNTNQSMEDLPWISSLVSSNGMSFDKVLNQRKLSARRLFTLDKDFIHSADRLISLVGVFVKSTNSYQISYPAILINYGGIYVPNIKITEMLYRLRDSGEKVAILRIKSGIISFPGRITKKMIEMLIKKEVILMAHYSLFEIYGKALQSK